MGPNRKDTKELRNRRYRTIGGLLRGIDNDNVSQLQAIITTALIASCTQPRESGKFFRHLGNYTFLS